MKKKTEVSCATCAHSTLDNTGTLICNGGPPTPMRDADDRIRAYQPPVPPGYKCGAHLYSSAAKILPVKPPVTTTQVPGQAN